MTTATRVTKEGCALMTTLTRDADATFATSATLQAQYARAWLKSAEDACQVSRERATINEDFTH